MAPIVPRLVRNSFGVTYVREARIRRQANRFEDLFQGHYGQPQVFPVPDELDPRLPRMVFSSTHGYSQISISQVNTSLNVTYSQEWQTDIARCREYLHERINLIFDAIQRTETLSPTYVGLTTVIHLTAEFDDKELVARVANSLLKSTPTDLFDILVKRVHVIDDMYYHNIVLENYRSWPQRSDERFPSREAEGRGISITGDFNDRYAFNERTSYFTNRQTANSIIDQGLDKLRAVADEVKEILE